jgi:hypothetical protein
MQPNMQLFCLVKMISFFSSSHWQSVSLKNGSQRWFLRHFLTSFFLLPSAGFPSLMLCVSCHSSSYFIFLLVQKKKTLGVVWWLHHLIREIRWFASLQDCFLTRPCTLTKCCVWFLPKGPVVLRDGYYWEKLDDTHREPKKGIIQTTTDTSGWRLEKRCPRVTTWISGNRLSKGDTVRIGLGDLAWREVWTELCTGYDVKLWEYVCRWRQTLRHPVATCGGVCR